MLLVPVAYLRPGMVLAEPVLHPDKDCLLLLGEGYTLDAKTIRQLISNRVAYAWVSFPGLEDLKAPSRDIALGHMELIRVLNTSIDRLERRVSVSVNVQHYRKAVHQMLAEIVSDPSHDPLTHQLAGCGPVLAGHLANTAYLSLLVGAHLGGYLREQRKTLSADFAENTAPLGLGALLHDVGKIFMPEAIRDTTILDELSDSDEYRTHTLAGYREVRDHVPSVAAYIVLNHHQRFDGNGFPGRSVRHAKHGEPLSGAHIHVFARIVACVNVFDHLLCPRGIPRPTIMAIHDLKSERFNGWFDPVILDTLVRLVPAFMVGSMVRLSSDQHAVVVASHPDVPTRPTVRLLTGPLTDESSRVTARQLDLRMCRGLTIVESEGHDVRAHIEGVERSAPFFVAA